MVKKHMTATTSPAERLCDRKPRMSTGKKLSQKNTIIHLNSVKKNSLEIIEDQEEN